jgi:hypothetical protein
VPPQTDIKSKTKVVKFAKTGPGDARYAKTCRLARIVTNPKATFFPTLPRIKLISAIRLIWGWFSMSVAHI